MKNITEHQKITLLFLGIASMPLWMTVAYKLALELWCIAYGLVY